MRRTSWEPTSTGTTKGGCSTIPDRWGSLLRHSHDSAIRSWWAIPGLERAFENESTVFMRICRLVPGGVQMMRVSSRRSVKEAPRITQNASSDVSFSPSFLWHLLMHFAEYRMELPIREVMVFPNGHAYYVCPRCNITLEREFMSYCDRCGQHLGWNSYRKAKVIYPGNREEVHT